MYSLTTREI